MEKINIQFSKQVEKISFEIEIVPYRIPTSVSISNTARQYLEQYTSAGVKVRFYEEGNPNPVSVHETSIRGFEKTI